jgi:hypothetical protein
LKTARQLHGSLNLKRGASYNGDISQFEEMRADCHLKRNDCNSKLVRVSTNFEYAGARIRNYPRTLKKILELAQKRRTSLAQVIAEKFNRV